MFINEYYNNKIEKNVILKNQGLISKKFVETGAILYTKVIKRFYQNKVLAELKGIHIEPCYMDQLLKYIK
ncbi:hypothetical protein MUB24_12710 [Lederbergia sp. NSJ-179]|uniref:hypothetical protein n=1 Tax=Lederbergia sp. NSJ-179 TaxID=2931402 RepID=UPI001FD41902|nr:hypothetical protein [Lederbergia sp. NSJ-179]MCJ7841743.1 hypothetical protein [Lederbergia sp. NSJ-179]